jgi:hypothetical protein
MEVETLIHALLFRYFIYQHGQQINYVTKMQGKIRT